jgi:hypothetical protein
MDSEGRQWLDLHQAFLVRSAFIPGPTRSGVLAMIQYHGWSDPQSCPGFSVEYYRSVVEKFGKKTVDPSYRLLGSLVWPTAVAEKGAPALTCLLRLTVAGLREH